MALIHQFKKEGSHKGDSFTTVLFISIGMQEEGCELTCLVVVGGKGNVIESLVVDGVHWDMQA